MGGKVWTFPEEKYFWRVAVASSPKRAGIDRAKAEKPWDQLASEMQRAMGHKAKRTYSGTMLFEHYFQNVESQRWSPHAAQFVNEHLGKLGQAGRRGRGGRSRAATMQRPIAALNAAITAQTAAITGNTVTHTAQAVALTTAAARARADIAATSAALTTAAARARADAAAQAVMSLSRPVAPRGPRFFNAGGGSITFGSNVSFQFGPTGTPTVTSRAPPTSTKSEEPCLFVEDDEKAEEDMKDEKTEEEDLEDEDADVRIYATRKVASKQGRGGARDQ
ncbi:Uu.00g086940.m01.CDS01 [Anthostomella pinea]|uniref:Uu.00g086940.m01.CDS01 n=1 Tax=Anthostomella pinea TaxID=933095 RepID=A0AAI8VGU4_9PEZI|nr:Uu.00g086940.m01.CDS01 [Anthostomella pinea]